MKKALLFLLGLLFVNESFANDIAANITNPVCDNATLEKYNGTANVEIDWVPNTIALRWYNGEQQLSVPTESQSCTYDGAMVIPSAPTRTGYTFMGWTVIDVPNGYTKLEYLESTGTQYIDTNYVPNNNTGVKTKIQFDSIENNYSLCFGSGKSYYENAFEFYLSSQRAEFNYGNIYQFSGPTRNVNDIVEIDWQKNVVNFKMNNEEVQTLSWSMYNFSAPISMSLFAVTRKTSEGVNRFKGKVKIYYFKIYENDELVRDFLPVLDPQNVPCMYDKVSGQCFYNAGTGTFIAGPVAQ